MRKRQLIFFLPLAIGCALFAQNTDTQALSITVSLASGSLLTGKTPANYTAPPSGWSTLCTQDFENGVVASCVTGTHGAIGSDFSLSSSQNHSGGGSRSAYETYGASASVNQDWAVQLPSTSQEVYMSWWERKDSYPSGMGPAPYPNVYFAQWGPSRGQGIRLDASCCGGPWPYGAPAGQYTQWLTSYTRLTFVGANQYGSEDINGVNGWLNAGISQNFDGQWHQWEMWFKGNDANTANGNFKVWVDGKLVGQTLNVALDKTPTANFHGMYAQISGWSSWTLYLQNATTWTKSDPGSCYQLVRNWDACQLGNCSGTQPVCATNRSNVSQNGWCDASFVGDNLGFAKINQICPGLGQAPATTFNKYIDDVIMLYK